MKFCSACGEALIRQIPPGDNRERMVCSSCGQVHYQNPLVVVGSVPLYRGSILLCRRAIEPRRGYWTVPAGFLELGETLGEGALRETWEEALLHVELGPLMAVIDVVHAGQVHVFFSAAMTTAEFGAGEETLESRLFPLSEIPWEDIAFRSVGMALRHRLAQLRQGHSEILLTRVEPPE